MAESGKLAIGDATDSPDFVGFRKSVSWAGVVGDDVLQVSNEPLFHQQNES